MSRTEWVRSEGNLLIIRYPLSTMLCIYYFIYPWQLRKVLYSSCDIRRSWESWNWHHSPGIGFFLSAQWWISWGRLVSYYWKCGPMSTGILWKFVRNAESQVPLKTHWSRILVFKKSLAYLWSEMFCSGVEALCLQRTSGLPGSEHFWLFRRMLGDQEFALEVSLL